MKIPTKRVNIGGENFEIPDFAKLLGGGFWGILIVVIVLWLLSGIYIVKADQQGVIRRFGEYVSVTGPGIHWKIPFPIEQVDRPSIMEVKRAEIGFRTVDPGPPARYSDRPDESLMLTGNLNIVDCDMIVQYRITDAIKYLFNVRDIDRTVTVAAEAALRLVIGKHEIDEALTTGKGQIQQETKDQLQEILNIYDAGLNVVAVQLQNVHPPQAVVDAFKDVASAKEDKNRRINEAQGYYNAVIPRARGQAVQVEKAAEAWASERVTQAEGNAENFVRILTEYRRSKVITRRRLLLETMEEILPGVRKYILKTDNNSSLLNVIGLEGNPATIGGRR